jgi:predicted amidohydrolase
MGTRARIATVCMGRHFYPSIEQNRAYVLDLLDLALTQNPDLVCLPETFPTVTVQADSIDELAEPVPGPTVDAVARRARKAGCYVICPLKTVRQGVYLNSAVVLDRSGEVAGIYDKVHPVTTSNDYTLFEGGTFPGPVDPPVFDLDFGRVGIQICFDAGFPETWQALAEKGAQIVFWPSAYNGGFPLQVYAYLHHYYVISSVRTDKSRIVDPLGNILEETNDLTGIVCHDLNTDYAVCHYDFNYTIPDRIMAAYPGQVAIRTDRDSAHFLVEPKDDKLTIAQLQAEFGFESTFLYHQRHRDAFAQMAQGQAPSPQKAAHSDRSQYSK